MAKSEAIIRSTRVGSIPCFHPLYKSLANHASACAILFLLLLMCTKLDLSRTLKLTCASSIRVLNKPNQAKYLKFKFGHYLILF